MPSRAADRFEENRKDIEQLWAIHEDVAGEGPGRKHGVDVLNRAAIIFITACWESFVEDLATEAFDFLLANVPNAQAVPTKVRNFSTRSLLDQKDPGKLWDLADSGWRQLLISHRAATIERWIGTLNTPKSAQTNALFEELLGIPQISAHWHWQRMTPEQAAEKLDSYITIRGNIAHRTEHDETVYRNWTEDYLGHVNSLVNKTEAATAAHLFAATGRQPW
jgi:hypothetical protein